jgi:hypothetical protein
MRDEFSAWAKDLLAKRVGQRCSNPSCRQPTSGPQDDATKAINIGVAAHIAAASPGGPRYDSEMTPEQRGAPNNGLWLCQNCAKLVDNDSARYPAELLRSWKAEAEGAAASALERRVPATSSRVEFFVRMEYPVSPSNDGRMVGDAEGAPLDEVSDFATSIQDHMAKLHRHVEKLTHDQYRAILQLRGLREVRISGCAGSGKTLVAAEKAIRLSKAGLRTLFLCHNPLLAEHVVGLTIGSGVEVSSFGNWISRLAGDAKAEIAGAWSNFLEPQDEALNRAFDCLGATGSLYDAVIVDEGQDFRAEWWALVQAAFGETGLGILYIFHDDHQALLPHRSTYPFSGPIIDLSRNCRNGGKVYEAMQAIFSSTAMPEEELRDLGGVSIRVVDEKGDADELQKAVRWLWKQTAGAPFVVLLSGGIRFENSVLSQLTVPVSDHVSWQEAVRREFEKVKQYDARGVMHLVSGQEDTQRLLELLSTAPFPTADDVELVRKVARRYGVHPQIRKRIANHPEFYHAMLWEVRGDEVRLNRPRKAPIWGAEILLHFERKDWHASLPEPTTVSFRRFDELPIVGSMPVYHVGEFKGLEADFVLLFVRGPVLAPSHEVYVGVSRARFLLAAVIDSHTALTLPIAFRNLVVESPTQ